MAGEATRYIASFIVEFFSDFMCFAIKQNNLTPEEVVIICLVAAESTREIRKDPFAMRHFGTEEFAFPDTERPTVSVKVIHTRLGLSRETTRRKVAGLVERGFLKRTRGGVFLPAQTGEDDYTREIRNFLVRKLDVLNAYRDKMPD
jgi:DNA-binding MarR family transcriptional regulator